MKPKINLIISLLALASFACGLFGPKTAKPTLPPVTTTTPVITATMTPEPTDTPLPAESKCVYPGYLRVPPGTAATVIVDGKDIAKVSYEGNVLYVYDMVSDETEEHTIPFDPMTVTLLFHYKLEDGSIFNFKNTVAICGNVLYYEDIP
jgi:hypothetical protein